MKEYLVYNIFELDALIDMEDITIQQANEYAENGFYPEWFYRENDEE